VRRDRFLTKGFTVVRRALAAVGAGRQPEWYYQAQAAQAQE
jgi:hypothetical protein